MRFELYVAARYLKAKRRQAVVGVVTAISVAGVTAGVAALIIALAITNGMRHDLQDKLINSSAHVQLMQVDGMGIADWQSLLARLRAVPHVVAASPGLYEQVLVARGARDGGALIEGILPDDERTVSDLLSKATPGAVQALEPAVVPQVAPVVAPQADSQSAPVNPQNAELSAAIWPTPSALWTVIRSSSSVLRAR
jgi:lipoprotein-releasing system permease protein